MSFGNGYNYRLRSGLHIPSLSQQFRQKGPMCEEKSDRASPKKENDEDVNALLAHLVYLQFPNMQGAEEGGQGSAPDYQQVHQAWGAAPPKDTFTIPKFKVELAELPDTSSVLSRCTLYSDRHPYSCGPIAGSVAGQSLLCQRFRMVRQLQCGLKML